jgi:hypothetical protein
MTSAHFGSKDTRTESCLICGEPIVQLFGTRIENLPYCSLYFLNCPVAVCENAWPLSNAKTNRKNIPLIVTEMAKIRQANVYYNSYHYLIVFHLRLTIDNGISNTK